MEGNHAIKFYLIADYFKNNTNLLRRGENAYASGNVKKMLFDSEIQPAHLQGEVAASMKKRVYRVQISIHLLNGVASSSCTCPRGQSLCHHIAALLYYGHYNISSTDKAKTWGVTQSRKEHSAIATSIDELYPREKFTALVGEIDNKYIEEFRRRLGNTNIVGCSWLLKPEADNRISKLLQSIDDILFSEEYLKAEHKDKYLTEKCSIEFQKITEVAEATVVQHENENWLITRKMRLTASNFGLVINACRRNRFPPSLFKNLMEHL